MPTEHPTVTVPQIAVIIPSKTASNLSPCLSAVRAHDPGVRLIVVDDDDTDGVRQVCKQWEAERVQGVKPFVFARNVNIGIREAMRGKQTIDVTILEGDNIVADERPDGVIIANDDCLLETPGGFTLLAQEAAAHPEYGVIGATTNLTGQPAQRPRKVGLREVEWCAFVCVYIPRTTLHRVGLIDERFVAYGSDDQDYCRSVRAAGLKIGVHDGCYVDHGSLRSTFRGDPWAPGDCREGRRILKEKWGY